jgi:hypothetical protein
MTTEHIQANLGATMRRLTRSAPLLGEAFPVPVQTFWPTWSLYRFQTVQSSVNNFLAHGNWASSCQGGGVRNGSFRLPNSLIIIVAQFIKPSCPVERFWNNRVLGLSSLSVAKFEVVWMENEIMNNTRVNMLSSRQITGLNVTQKVWML